jgi:hypothetical protein
METDNMSKESLFKGFLSNKNLTSVEIYKEIFGEDDEFLSLDINFEEYGEPLHLSKRISSRERGDIDTVVGLYQLFAKYLETLQELENPKTEEIEEAEIN